MGSQRQQFLKRKNQYKRPKYTKYNNRYNKYNTQNMQNATNQNYYQIPANNNQQFMMPYPMQYQYIQPSMPQMQIPSTVQYIQPSVPQIIQNKSIINNKQHMHSVPMPNTQTQIIYVSQPNY